MKRRTGPLRFMAVAILAYALAGLAAAFGHDLILGRLQGAWPAPWVAGIAGLVVAFAVAIPLLLFLRRQDGGKSGPRPQKAGDGTDRGAIL
jgi:hypothetical protein